MINKTAWPAVAVEGFNHRSATATAWYRVFELRSALMQFKMTIATKRQPIGNLKAKFGAGRVGLDVMRCQTTLILFALFVAMLTDVNVPLEH